MTKCKKQQRRLVFTLVNTFGKRHEKMAYQSIVNNLVGLGRKVQSLTQQVSNRDEYIASLEAQLAEARRVSLFGNPSQSCSVGVGDGSGNLVVHGTYESVKQVQRIILQAEADRGRLAAAETVKENWKERAWTAEEKLAAAESESAKWKEEAIKAHEESEIVLARLAKVEEAGRKLSLEWVYEDELPDGYPYDEMFPFSKVDIVRMFPIFVTIRGAGFAEVIEDEEALKAGVNALVDCMLDCGDAEQGLRLALRAMLEGRN